MAGATFDSLMQSASVALVGREYLACEDLCLRALAGARQHRAWADYGRVLLPLQEARRHRRMIAAEGSVRLGTAGVSGVSGDLLSCLAPYPAACIVVTHPHGAADARALAAEARRSRRFVEVLFADNPVTAPRWRLRGLAGPEVACAVPAPPAAWLDRWFERSAPAPAPPAAGLPPTPADWFLDAGEALGDQALRQAAAATGAVARLEALAQCLEVVTDHELIHQHLWDAARALSLASHP
jgi:hypothetical protein